MRSIKERRAKKARLKAVKRQEELRKLGLKPDAKGLEVIGAIMAEYIRGKIGHRKNSDQYREDYIKRQKARLYRYASGTKKNGGKNVVWHGVHFPDPNNWHEYCQMSFALKIFTNIRKL